MSPTGTAAAFILIGAGFCRERTCSSCASPYEHAEHCVYSLEECFPRCSRLIHAIPFAIKTNNSLLLILLTDTGAGLKRRSQDRTPGTSPQCCKTLDRDQGVAISLDRALASER